MRKCYKWVNCENEYNDTEVENNQLQNNPSCVNITHITYNKVSIPAVVYQFL